MTDLPDGAVTAATENITAFLLGCGWTIPEAADVAPRLADNVVAAVVPAIASIERERWAAAITELHSEFRIYDECDHDHTAEDVAAGTAVDAWDFISCHENYLYSVCRECCIESGFGQSEQCANDHDHGKDKPICATAALIAGVETS